MNEQTKLAGRLDAVRRDLDEIAEQLARVVAEEATRADDVEHGLVGQTEIAAMLDVSPNVVGTWIARGKLPPPLASLACGRIWLRADIVAWAARQAPPP